MREIRSSGSVEGVLSDGHPYSDSLPAERDAGPFAHLTTGSWPC